MKRLLAILLLTALLMPATGATYYADSIQALGYNATLTGTYIGDTSTNNYLSTSSTGSGSTNLYIGNERILTDADTLSSAGGWTDDGSTVRLTTSSDNVNANTLYVNNANGEVSIGSLTIQKSYERFIDTRSDMRFYIDSNNDQGGADYGFYHDGPNTSAATQVAQIGADGDTWFTPAGDVGIGTSGPGALLHVYDSNSGGSAETNTHLLVESSGGANIQILSGAATNGALQFGDSGDGNAGQLIYDHGGNAMRLYTNGAEQLRIDSDGDLGVGTTNPTGTLHIQDANSDTEYLRITDDSNTGLIRMLTSASYNDAPQITLHNATGSTKALIGAGRDSYLLGGNLGIGTNNPGYALDVDGNAQFGDIVYLGRGTSHYLRGDNVGSRLYSLGLERSGSGLSSPDIYDAGGDGLVLGGSGSDNNQLVVESGGNVGVGTASPATTLDVQGNIYGDGHLQLYRENTPTVDDNNYNLHLGYTVKQGQTSQKSNYFTYLGSDVKYGNHSGKEGFYTQGSYPQSHVTLYALDGDGLGTLSANSPWRDGYLKQYFISDYMSAVNRVHLNDTNTNWVYGINNNYDFIAGDDDELVVDTSTDRVGIGTSGPANTLDVNGGIDANTLNTGQGDNDLYAMNQNVRTSDSVEFQTVTIDTNNQGSTTDLKLNANANIATDNSMYLWVDSASDGGDSFYFRKGQGYGSGTSLMTISNGGDITVHGGDITFGSTGISESDVGIIDDGSIALTTETSGNYVSSVSGGNAISISGSASEGWTPSVAVTADSIDGDELADSITLDANLDVDAGTLFIDQSANRIGAGTTSPASKLDVQGSAYADHFEQGNDDAYAQAGTGAADARIAMYGMTVAYATIEDNTKIYVNGVRTVDAATPSTGSFSANAGDVIRSNKPVGLRETSKDIPLPPLAAAGTQHAFYSSRNQPHTVYVYAPYGAAEVAYHYNEVPDSTPNTTVTVQPGQIQTITATAEGTHRFTSTSPVLMQKVSSGDYLFVPPASKEVVHTFSENQVTMDGSSITSFSNIRLTSSSPLSSTQIADGSGGDAEMGLPYRLLGDTYALDHTVGDYAVASIEPNTIRVYNWTGSQFSLYAEYDHSAASRNNPVETEVGAQGGGTDLGLNPPILVTGTAPFYLRTNGDGNDEYSVIGYRTGQRATGGGQLDHPFGGDTTTDFEARQLQLETGTAVNEFSTDTNLGDSSDDAVPTENAVKSYVDSNSGDGHTGSGTANTVAKWTGTSSLGDSSITDDGSTVTTTSNVGIGTGSVGAELDIEGTNPTLRLQSTGDSSSTPIDLVGDNQGLQVRVDDANSLSTSYIDLYADNTQIVRFLKDKTYWNSGDIGIGTTGPGAKLHVEADSIQNTGLRLDHEGGGGVWDFVTGISGDAHRILYIEEQDTGNKWLKFDENDDELFLYTSGSERLTINNLGDIGIGTTGPGARLEVEGEDQNASLSKTGLTIDQDYADIGTNDLQGPVLRFRGDTWTYGAIVGTVGTPSDISGYPGGLAFYTKDDTGVADENMVERMRIDHNGNVAIGGTTPANTLDVNGGIDADTLNTGQGDNDLYAMNQDVESGDSVSFQTLTLNTNNQGSVTDLKLNANANVATDNSMYLWVDGASDGGDSFYFRKGQGYGSGTSLMTVSNGGDLTVHGGDVTFGSTAISESDVGIIDDGTISSGEADFANQNLLTTSSPTFNDVTLGSSETALVFDSGADRITVHDGFGNFNILSGIDHNNNIVGSTSGGTRIEMSESGYVDFEIYDSGGSEVTSLRIAQSGAIMDRNQFDMNGQTLTGLSSMQDNSDTERISVGTNVVITVG